MQSAVIAVGGKQYQVSQGQELLLDLIDTPVGQPVTFDQVYLLVTDKQIHLGTPTVSGAKVTAQVLAHLKGKKIRVATYKAKSRYRKVKGHRQHLTRVKITSIVSREK